MLMAKASLTKRSAGNHREQRRTFLHPGLDVGQGLGVGGALGRHVLVQPLDLAQLTVGGHEPLEARLEEHLAGRGG